MLEWSVSLGIISVGSDGTAHRLNLVISSAPLFIIVLSLIFNDIYVNFIDFKAAFDSIRREFIWSSMRH